MIDEAKPILATIDKTLFVAEERRLKAAIDALVMANNEAHKQILSGFFYNGDYYLHSKMLPSLQSVRVPKPTLHISLNDQMQTHIRDKVTVKLDRDQIKQILYKLTYPCLSIQEVRDALPECLVSLVPELNKLRREKRQGMFFFGDQRTERQFLILLPKMEMYAVSRFLY